MDHLLSVVALLLFSVGNPFLLIQLELVPQGIVACMLRGEKQGTLYAQ